MKKFYVNKLETNAIIKKEISEESQYTIIIECISSDKNGNGDMQLTIIPIEDSKPIDCNRWTLESISYYQNWSGCSLSGLKVIDPTMHSAFISFSQSKSEYKSGFYYTIMGNTDQPSYEAGLMIIIEASLNFFKCVVTYQSIDIYKTAHLLDTMSFDKIPKFFSGTHYYNDDSKYKLSPEQIKEDFELLKLTINKRSVQIEERCVDIYKILQQLTIAQQVEFYYQKSSLQLNWDNFCYSNLERSFKHFSSEIHRIMESLKYRKYWEECQQKVEDMMRAYFETFYTVHRIPAIEECLIELKAYLVQIDMELNKQEMDAFIKSLDEFDCKLDEQQKQLFNDVMLQYNKFKNKMTVDQISAFERKFFEIISKQY